MIIKVPFFKQDTEYSCGPASLQMLFRFYGKIISEEDLTKRLVTKKDIGTGHGHIIDVAREEGFYVFVNNDSSLEEIVDFIESSIPVMIHFIEPSAEDEHYSIVVGLDNRHIILNDPWNGEKFKITRDDFLKRWKGENGKHKQWLMVISRSDFSLGKQYTPF